MLQFPFRFALLGRIRRSPSMALLGLMLGLSVTPTGLTQGQETTASTDDPRTRAELVEQVQVADDYGQTLSLGSIWTQDYFCVLFMGTECPLARLYVSRFEALASRFEGQSIDFALICANVQDTPTELQRFRAAHDLTLPILKDLKYDLVDAWNAVRTPEAMIIDEQGRILYRGRIDDQYLVGQLRTAPNREDLRIALEELLSGRPISVAETPTQGCRIGRPRTVTDATDKTFAKHIAPLLNQHCVECHREGDIGPMPLVEYDEVVGWAETILEVVEDGRMPPWHATKTDLPFKNRRGLSAEEQATLAEWVAGGTPSGTLDEVPPPPKFADRWRLPEPPDLVIDMAAKPYRVPAQGVVDYQYYVVDPGWTEDHWIRASQVLPGNPQVVHHTIVFVRTPNNREFEGLGWLGGYVPGQPPMLLEPGQARRIPAGSKLVFQMHYTPVGREVEDLTQIGLWFSQEAEVDEEVRTAVLLDQDFEIPPGAANYAVSAELRGFPEGTSLISLTPHMHYRGKSMRVSAELDSGSTLQLLNVPRYDFNWQNDYQFEQRLPLTPQTQLSFEATFDNSSSNPVNPDPTVAVRWGEQSWEEMAIVFANLAVPKGSEFRPQRSAARVSPDAALAKAQEFLGRFDQNEDGFIQRKEAPETFSVFAFSRLDLDGDERLSLDELIGSSR